MLRTLS